MCLKGSTHLNQERSSNCGSVTAGCSTRSLTGLDYIDHIDHTQHHNRQEAHAGCKDAAAKAQFTADVLHVAAMVHDGVKTQRSFLKIILTIQQLNRLKGGAGEKQSARLLARMFPALLLSSVLLSCRFARFVQTSSQRPSRGRCCSLSSADTYRKTPRAAPLSVLLPSAHRLLRTFS